MLLVASFDCYSISKGVKVNIAIPHLLLENFRTQTKNTQCRNIDVTALNLGPARGVVDAILLCKVLELSSIDFDVYYIPTYTYRRSLRLLENGEADITAETVWEDKETNKYAVFSEAVIPKGVFTKGLYTLPNHPLQTFSDVEHKIKHYSAVARKHWKYDWQKLLQITPYVTNASSYQATFKMLGAGRADFTLLEFGSSPDLSVTLEGVKMIPINNVKIVLPMSRHFAVSRKSKLAELLIENLNIEIDKLNNKGVIKDAYSAIGFYKPKVESWISL